MYIGAGRCIHQLGLSCHDALPRAVASTQEEREIHCAGSVAQLRAHNTCGVHWGDRQAAVAKNSYQDRWFIYSSGAREALGGTRRFEQIRTAPDPTSLNTSGYS